MDKEVIIRNFSRYAKAYDKYADIQSRSALELAGKIKKDNFSTILEIGCGTGNYTLILRDKFKNARFKAVDISDSMIAVAREKLKEKGIEFITADAENMHLKGIFDLITSNACFQWFADLDEAVFKYKKMLKKDGLILFSIFGPRTFSQLNFSLRSILNPIALEASNFKTKEELKKILTKSFRKVTINESRYQESFQNLAELLKKIKYSGVRGSGLNGTLHFNRGFLKSLEKTYLENFKGIKATYQVFFCEGIA